MADDPLGAPDLSGAPNDSSLESESGAQRAEDAAAWSHWSNLWQIPTILVSGVMIAFGVHVAMSRAPANDFDGALQQVERLIEGGRFDVARSRLTEVIEPNLEEATPLQRARFYAAVADWLAASQADTGPSGLQATRLVVRHYTEAQELGLTLSPARLERWAHAFIALDDLQGAGRRLQELDALDLGADAAEEIRLRRNRVLRAMVGHSLAKPDLAAEQVLAILADYRRDARLDASDELWAIARAAEVRLRAGQPRATIDHLLVEMRRLEARFGSESKLSFGELYVQLAQAHYDLGQFDDARFALELGLARLSASDPVRGDALALIGFMAVAEGDLEQALESFDEVVRQFVGTPSHRPGLLGRAEVFSKLGRHEESQSDYRRLRDSWPLFGAGDVTRRRIARSLLDRHDAALTTGDLDLALAYAEIAESFFEPDTVPADVLFRLAFTNRQAGENLLPPPPADPTDPRPAVRRLAGTDPAVRANAAAHFATAARYFVRHARAVRLDPGEEEAWAQSLWMAADSYDRAGHHDEAIRHFREYISGRGDEPRRAEAQYRLGLAQQAVFDHEAAIGSFEQLLSEHPRVLIASMSHVPLARSYLALDRQPEAEAELLAVLAGDRHVTPESVHYRDALIELSRIYHNSGAWIKGIERLGEALERYPEDPRRAEVLFRLADSYRRSAAQIAEQVASAPALAPSERLRLTTLRTDQLRRAMQLFDLVVSEQDLDGTEPAPSLEADFLRGAFYYRADCAYDLGLYPEAIEYYTQAARKYRDHHSSMHALIQIYNCYRAQDDVENARNAHRRALVRLAQLPDRAFEAPDALMDRAAWERWLRNSPVGAVAAAGTSDG